MILEANSPSLTDIVDTCLNGALLYYNIVGSFMFSRKQSASSLVIATTCSAHSNKSDFTSLIFLILGNISLFVYFLPTTAPTVNEL